MKISRYDFGPCVYVCEFPCANLDIYLKRNMFLAGRNHKQENKLTDQTLTRLPKHKDVEEYVITGQYTNLFI